MILKFVFRLSSGSPSSAVFWRAVDFLSVGFLFDASENSILRLPQYTSVREYEWPVIIIMYLDWRNGRYKEWTTGSYKNKNDKRLIVENYAILCPEKLCVYISNANDVETLKFKLFSIN